MADLVAAGNTYNPSLLVLKKKGYKLWVEVGDDRNIWCASRNDREFAGYSPPELLGVCCLWEEFGEAWNIQIPNLLKEIPSRDEEK